METAAWFVVWGLAPSLSFKVQQTMVKVFGVERAIDIPSDSFPSEQELNQLEALMPASCQHGWYDSVYEQVKLHYRYFVGDKPKAVLIFQHGIATHGGKAMITKSGRKLNATLMAEQCAKHQIALYMPDMYGHGYSEGTRWLIPGSWRNNLQDLMNFIKLVEQKHPSLPIFLMGESYGGTLVIHAAREYQDHPASAPANFAGILLTGPAILADLPPYPVYCLLRYVLAPNFPKWRPFFMPNPVSPERIWRDQEVLRYRTHPHQKSFMIDGSGIAFRLGTALNLVQALEVAEKSAIVGFRQPFCLIHGVEDAGVPVEGSDLMWQKATAEKKEYHRIDGAYHDLLSDPAAEECMQTFVNFMVQQMN